jgi:hypothetical protein
LIEVNEDLSNGDNSNLLNFNYADINSLKEKENILAKCTEDDLSDGCSWSEMTGLEEELSVESDDEITNTFAAIENGMTNELLEREKGQVDIAVYLAWMKAAGGFCVFFILLCGYGLQEGLTTLSKWWLTYWSQHADSSNDTSFLMIYALINLAAMAFMFIRVMILSLQGLRASRVLFADVRTFTFTFLFLISSCL